MAQEIHNATEVANESREASGDRRPDMASAGTLRSESAVLPGEGVGLSIVKRLCELLDAGLELATAPGQGSTFRVILPRGYKPRSLRLESFSVGDTVSIGVNDQLATA
jgi:hypothetical protein